MTAIEMPSTGEGTPVTLSAAVAAGVGRHRAVLCDLDGCLVAGGRLLAGAAELWRDCGPRLCIVSNNSTDTAEGLAERLAGLGLPVPAARILLAGEETLRLLAREAPGAGIALFAAPPLQDLARQLGLDPRSPAPEVAVLMRDTGFGFAALARLAALVHRGVPLWIANPDASHPAADGTPVPETGALLAALAAMLPGLTVARSPGKPASDLMVAALARLGAAPAEAVCLGDTAATDGAAARALGIRFVLVGQIAVGAAGAGGAP